MPFVEKSQLQPALDWFETMGWSPFSFQLEAWESYLNGQSGLVNAPTGSGKTYSLIVPILLETSPRSKTQLPRGPLAIWITPIRALSKEIRLAAEKAVEGLNSHWRVAVRSGDTKLTERARQKTKPPHLLITTPESLHVLMAQKGYEEYFKNLRAVVADEWHELM